MIDTVTRGSKSIKYWQVASGAGDREYHEEFVKWGIAFVGERYWCPKPPERGKGMRHVSKGDRILLRGRIEGTEEIVAVGEVVEHEGEHKGCGDKEILRDFDGWDLPAYCYVDWCPVRDKKKTSIRKTIAQVGENNGLRRYADSVLQNCVKGQSRDPWNMLREPEAIGLKEIAQNLVSRDSVASLLSKLHHIQKLANHYYDSEYKHWDEVKEHEIRTFLIVPLLLALGWDEKRMKIELSPRRLGVDHPGSIDIACFYQPYKIASRNENRENCQLIVESKRFSSGIKKEAPDQAKKYAKDLNNCKTIVVSNGYCYKAFVREDGEFSDTPHAYLNLLKPTRKYPLDPNVDGALQMLELLKA